MAIDKKLIHFKTKSNFMSANGVNGKVDSPNEGTSEELGNAEYGQIKGTSIVFIKDSKEIWTHGNLYKSVNWSVLEPKGIQYNMVDLGLPSGLKWADRNIGAANPEDVGLCFLWGDTVGYTAEQIPDDLDWDSYFDTTDGGSTFNKYAIDKLTTLEPIDDAATVNMGSNWRMPTKADWEELINNTTITADSSLNTIITGTNGNRILMSPYESNYVMLWLSDINNELSEWAYYIFIQNGDLIQHPFSTSRLMPMPVRAVSES